MHERPYLFKAQLVRATLAGTKTETRRVLRGSEDLVDQPGHGWVQAEGRVDGGGRKADRGRWLWCRGDEVRWAGPRWPLAGDSLWVRETWRVDASWDAKPPRVIPSQLTRSRSDHVYYEATGEKMRKDLVPGRIRQSIFMPRWASRITRKILEVRVERLQDIDGQGALAEGMPGPSGVLERAQEYPAGALALAQFRELWDQINAPKPDKPVVTWEANPLVVVTVFDVPS